MAVALTDVARLRRYIAICHRHLFLAEERARLGEITQGYYEPSETTLVNDFSSKPMSPTLFLPRLSNALHLSCNSTQIPKPILSYNQATANLNNSSTHPTITDDNNIRTDGIESKNEELSLSSSKPSSVIKAPTAPWMQGPLLVQSNQVLNFSKPRTNKDSTFGKTQDPDKALAGKASAGRGKKEMRMIFKGIKKLQEIRSSVKTHKDLENVKFKFSPGELWGGGSSEFDEKVSFLGENKMMEAGKSVEVMEFDFRLGNVEDEGKSKIRKKMPWETNEKLVSVRVKEKLVTAAELSLDKELLERLRDEASRMSKWVKVNKAGVTQAVVDQVHFTWKNNELAMLKFNLPLCQNMDRAREIVEMKTGGLVVWRKKDALVVYRGCNDQLALQTYAKIRHTFACESENSSFDDYGGDTTTASETSPVENGLVEMINETDIKENVPINVSLYDREADRLLDGLGPRFVDWWYPKPLPVDGDLLPEVVSGFMPPFRLCPSHARSKLTDDELTYLRKLARPLPTHFVLGRNRKLQGLSVAILKLWEKCHIAKIAVKWGIPNTDHKQMAYELKHLTGGVLLLCNKFFIILYRGKDFLPPRVAEIVTVREMELSTCQLREENARLRASETFISTEIPSAKFGTSGTLSEYLSIQSACLDLEYGKSKVDIELETEKERLEKELRNQQHRHHILKKKTEKSARVLAELSSRWRQSEQDTDQEMITQEERECLRKIGLKMESSLVLGRRGIFDGIIESMHQHWKHREIVKVITFQRMFSQVDYTAKVLEAESGGILVSIDKLKEGHAIMMYRGKNYRRPKLATLHLPNKRDALSRSLELQRIGSLKFFANQREQTISGLKSKLAEFNTEEN